MFYNQACSHFTVKCINISIVICLYFTGKCADSSYRNVWLFHSEFCGYFTVKCVAILQWFFLAILLSIMWILYSEMCGYLTVKCVAISQWKAWLFHSETCGYFTVKCVAISHWNVWIFHSEMCGGLKYQSVQCTSKPDRAGNKHQLLVHFKGKVQSVWGKENPCRQGRNLSLLNAFKKCDAGRWIYHSRP